MIKSNKSNKVKEQFRVGYGSRYKKFSSLEDAIEFKNKYNIGYDCIEFWTLYNNEWTFQDFIETEY